MAETPRKHLLEASYSDMEGLLLNLGIISVLMLSIAIPLYSSISIDDLLLGQYRTMLIDSLDFRRVVVWELSKMKFNFNVSLGPDITFDVKAALELPHPHETWWTASTSYIDTIENVFLLTKDWVPKWIIIAEAKKKYTLVFNIRRCYVVSVSLFTIVLLTALFLYVSITVSGYREREEERTEFERLKKMNQDDENMGKDAIKEKIDKPLEKVEQTEDDNQCGQRDDEPSRSPFLESLTWDFALFMVFLLYVASLIGIYFVFWGFMDVMKLRFPALALTHALLDVVGYRAGLSMIGMTLAISVAVLCLLQLGHRCYAEADRQPSQQPAIGTNSARVAPEENPRLTRAIEDEAGQGSEYALDLVENMSCQSGDRVNPLGRGQWRVQAVC